MLGIVVIIIARHEVSVAKFFAEGAAMMPEAPDFVYTTEPQ